MGSVFNPTQVPFPRPSPQFMREDAPRVPQLYFPPNHPLSRSFTPIKSNQTRPSSESPSPINCLLPPSKTNFLLSPFYTHQQISISKPTFPFTCVYTLLHSFNPPSTLFKLPKNKSTPLNSFTLFLLIDLYGPFNLNFDLRYQHAFNLAQELNPIQSIKITVSKICLLSSSLLLPQITISIPVTDD